MKKRLCCLFLTLSCLLSLVSCSSGGGDSVVNVYNWGEYIDESIFDDFEAQTGIHVN